MKKIKRSLLITILTLLSIVLVSCKDNKGGNDKKEVSDDGNKGSTSSEDFFVWDSKNEKIIEGLTVEGKKQNSLVIPERCEELKDSVFRDSNVTEVSFESDKDVILDGCFKSARSIERITLPKELTEVGNLEFSECINLNSITIPGTVNELGEGAFRYNEKLTNVVIEDGLIVIKEYAFMECKSLEEVTLPNTLTTIEKYAFYEITSLKSVKLPATLKTVDKGAFTNSGLTDIYCAEELELESYDKGAFMNNVGDATKVHVVEGSWADENFEDIFEGVLFEKVYYEE